MAGTTAGRSSGQIAARQQHGSQIVQVSASPLSSCSRAETDTPRGFRWNGRYERRGEAGDLCLSEPGAAAVLVIGLQHQSWTSPPLAVEEVLTKSDGPRAVKDCVSRTRGRDDVARVVAKGRMWARKGISGSVPTKWRGGLLRLSQLAGGVGLLPLRGRIYERGAELECHAERRIYAGEFTG